MTDLRIPFMVPCVPTGMKMGVSTTEWGRHTLVTLALVVGHLLMICVPRRSERKRTDMR